MKTYFVVLSVLFGSIAFAGSFNITITNPAKVEMKDAPVVIQLDNYKKAGITNRNELAVFSNKKQISSQLDDMNNDSIPDELVFLVDLKAGEKKTFTIKNIDKKKRKVFPSEVYSSLILKEADGSLKQIREISSRKNDMYNKLHHHGVAFESNLIAYRIYFDNKSTVDIYGKKIHRLELPETSWYPTGEQLKAGYGDDILLVSDWVGIGTVKGWDGKKAMHIDKFEKRTQRILSKGNIRVIAESEVKGWEYEGKKTDITVRYIMYARHRDVICEIRASEDLENLATGVQQIGGGVCFQSNQLVGSRGSWHPQPDKEKYPKETVGLGLFLPEKYKGKQQMSGVNNLIIFPYKKGDIVRFHFTAIADKEKTPIKTDEDFFKYLDNWRKELTELIVK